MKKNVWGIFILFLKTCMGNKVCNLFFTTIILKVCYFCSDVR